MAKKPAAKSKKLGTPKTEDTKVENKVVVDVTPDLLAYCPTTNTPNVPFEGKPLATIAGDQVLISGVSKDGHNLVMYVTRKHADEYIADGMVLPGKDFK